MTDDHEFLATTNPGLERVACREIEELVGADAERVYRGAVGFSAPASAAFALNRRSRGLHRVLVQVADGRVDAIEDVYDATRAVPFEEYFDPERSFGVRATRHGHHEFTSVDVGDRAGQAVVDRLRETAGTRIPVDLDDPDQVLRAFVRDDRYLLGIDTTGERSLHRRPYRVCEHDAPLRPTIAHQLLRLAGFEPGDDVLDPMCGSATIPTEAALWAAGRPPDPDRGYAYERLPFLDPSDSDPVQDPPGDAPSREDDPDDEGAIPGSYRGIDEQSRWVRCGRVNAEAAGLDGVVEVEEGDATEVDVDADVVVSNLPFGIRTVGDMAALYESFSENLGAGRWRTAALLTTSPDLLDLPVEREIPVTYGRLDATIVIADGPGR